MSLYKQPHRILFVCHGNICRSTMAEFVMKDLVERAGVADEFEIASAATSNEEIGNPVYPGTRKVLVEHGIAGFEGKRACRIEPGDYDAHDLLIGMDEANIHSMQRAFGGDPDGKIVKLLEFAGSTRDVADPWYTRDFDTTYSDVLAGCEGLLNALRV